MQQPPNQFTPQYQPQPYYPSQQQPQYPQQWQSQYPQPQLFPPQQFQLQPQKYQPPMPTQPQPPSRRKRNSTIWWISGVIACVLLIIFTTVGYTLISHSSFLGGCNLSASAGNSTSHVALASTYHGALAWNAPTLPMSLNSVNENQRGAICGTLVLGTLVNNSHPFTGTVTNNTITFTATLAGMTIPSTFTGFIGVLGDASIVGS